MKRRGYANRVVITPGNMYKNETHNSEKNTNVDT